jgi:hypothetical protein
VLSGAAFGVLAVRQEIGGLGIGAAPLAKSGGAAALHACLENELALFQFENVRLLFWRDRGFVARRLFSNRFGQVNWLG